MNGEKPISHNIVIKNCKIHGETDFYHYQRHNRSGVIEFCKKCNIENKLKYKKDNKRKAIEYLGGKCLNCGYDKDMAALDFHHLDPNKKEYEMSRLMQKPWNTIIKELDKCIILCSNCHRDTHHKNNTSKLKGHSERSKAKYRKLLVDAFQRKCSVCGEVYYNDYLYDFHHMCQKDKIFSISYGLMKHYKLKKNN